MVSWLRYFGRLRITDSSRYPNKDNIQRNLSCKRVDGMRKAVATSALTLTIILVALLSNVESVSALAFGSASLIYAHTFFDVFGTSPVTIPYGHLYSGSNCAAGNLIVSTQSIFGGFQVYVVLFGGYPAGPYSVQVDGDSSGCVNFTILPLPTTTVTVTNTVTAATTVTVASTVTLFTSSLAEYPYGLPILAILTIIAYGLVRRRNRN